MDTIFIAELYQDHPMNNIEEGMNLVHLLSQVLAAGIEGDVVELGCYKGVTGALLQTVLRHTSGRKRLLLYDSFQGLPEQQEEDTHATVGRGGCKAQRTDVEETFARLGLDCPSIIEGWFKDTLPQALPDRIAFAHIDGDYYSSVLESLHAIYPRMPKGAITVIDDYRDPLMHPKIQKMLNCNCRNRSEGRQYDIRECMPGVKKACDQFFSDKPEDVFILLAGDGSQGYFVKS